MSARVVTIEDVRAAEQAARPHVSAAPLIRSYAQVAAGNRPGKETVDHRVDGTGQTLERGHGFVVLGKQRRPAGSGGVRQPERAEPAIAILASSFGHAFA